MPPAATTSAQALGNLQNFQNSMQNPSDILTQSQQQLGVPAAQQQVSGLRQAITNTTNLLNQIPSSVYGRDANSLVTAGQAGRQVQNEQAPVSATLNKQSGQLNTTESDLQNLLKQASDKASLTEQGQQDKLTNLKNIYDALSAQEQAKASQSLEQQKLAEQIREANMPSKSSGGGGRSGGGGGRGSTTAAQKSADQSAAYKDLSQNTGKDGKVSPRFWNAARNNWVQAGYSAASFNSMFKNFINQSHAKDYA